jgi:hypothetical protein
MWQASLARFLIASIIAGVIGISGFLLSATVHKSEVTVHIEPNTGITIVGETFTTTLVVDSPFPTNVFRGVLYFDTSKLAIERIDYNTSLADLWAEEPWYSNGAGTLTFTGGTTKPGGFTGRDTLITITFRSTALGEARVGMKEVQVLKHDGLGTEAPLSQPIEALFTATPSVRADSSKISEVHIVTAIPDTDLNDDGTVNMIDVSVFLGDLITQNPRSDFSGDGRVTADDSTFFTIR